MSVWGIGRSEGEPKQNARYVSVFLCSKEKSRLYIRGNETYISVSARAQAK